MWPNAKRVMDSLVYIADLKTCPEDLLSETFINRLPPMEQMRISRLRREPDRKRSLLGLRMLEEAMNDAGYEWHWESFERNANGRPGVSTQTACDFNISHSGDIVVCAIGPGRLGIDVEKITPIDMDDIELVMPQLARKSILASSQPEKEFFRWWTRVESVIKANGGGFSVDTNSIRFSPQAATLGEQYLCYQDLDIVPGYACCLALVETAFTALPILAAS